MAGGKRLARLHSLRESLELVGVVNGRPCAHCGGVKYEVFHMAHGNTNGIYCSQCGAWVKFYGSKENKKFLKKY